MKWNGPLPRQDSNSNSNSDLRSLTAPKKFDIIYADPPWPEKKTKGAGSRIGIDRHFDTMTKEEMCSIPVADIASPSSLLFMWCTARHLPMALSPGGVIDSWGFDYITNAFTWIKVTKNDHLRPVYILGFYTQPNTEFCLLARRKGGNSIPPARNDVKSVILQLQCIEEEALLLPRPGSLGVKPREVVDRLDLMYPTQSKIEIFARTTDRPKSWVVIGDHVESRDIRQSIDLLSKGTWTPGIAKENKK